MYHCIVLEDYLDVLNLLQAVPGLVPVEAEDSAACGRQPRAAVFVRHHCG